MKLLQLFFAVSATSIAAAANCAKMTERKEMNGNYLNSINIRSY
jgi:hypothetical protein